MKRLLIIALMAVLSLTAGAQGKWDVSYRQADELIGQDAKSIYMYEAKGIGTVVVWDWSKPDFRLITDKGFFKATYCQGGKYYPVTVGFYDDNGNLEQKFSIQMLEEDNHGGKYIATGDFYIGGRGNIKKIMARMKSGKGYVRMVVDLYNKPPFDIKITPYIRK